MAQEAEQQRQRAELNFDKALRNMRVYVESLVVPAPGAPDIPEPPPGEAPTTDGEGAAEKAEHDGERPTEAATDDPAAGAEAPSPAAEDTLAGEPAEAIAEQPPATAGSEAPAAP